MVSLHVQTFIKNTLEEHKIGRKALAQLSGIAYSTIHDFASGHKHNPSLESIIKLADTFNDSVDKVLGNSPKINSVTKISNAEAKQNLRSFLKNHLTKNNISPIKLAREIGFSSGAISDFTQGKKSSLGAAIILKLSHHLNISIDEMIGRAAPSKAKEISPPQKPSVAAIVNKADLASLKSIKKSMKSVALKSSSSNSKTSSLSPTPNNAVSKNKNDSSHSR